MFSESSDQQFSKNHYGGGSENLFGGEVVFNKTVFGFLLNQPPAANQNSTKVHLLTLTNDCDLKEKNCCRSPWLSEISMVGWGDNTIINRVMS